MPYLRPMATVVADSISYGIDEDGAGVHDVIGKLGIFVTFQVLHERSR